VFRPAPARSLRRERHVPRTLDLDFRDGGLDPLQIVRSWRTQECDRLAVVGAAMGQYGGVWAHDEARKSFGIAGANVVDAPTFLLPIEALGGKPARENHHLVASLNDVLTKLAAQAG
jgi:hypothetical protein